MSQRAEGRAAPRRLGVDDDGDRLAAARERRGVARRRRERGAAVTTCSRVLLGIRNAQRARARRRAARQPAARRRRRKRARTGTRARRRRQPRRKAEAHRDRHRDLQLLDAHRQDAGEVGQGQALAAGDKGGVEQRLDGVGAGVARVGGLVGDKALLAVVGVWLLCGVCLLLLLGLGLLLCLFGVEGERGGKDEGRQGGRPATGQGQRARRKQETHLERRDAEAVPRADRHVEIHQAGALQLGDQRRVEAPDFRRRLARVARGAQQVGLGGRQLAELGLAFGILNLDWFCSGGKDGMQGQERGGKRGGCS